MKSLLCLVLALATMFILRSLYLSEFMIGWVCCMAYLLPQHEMFVKKLLNKFK